MMKNMQTMIGIALILVSGIDGLTGRGQERPGARVQDPFVLAFDILVRLETRRSGAHALHDRRSGVQDFLVLLHGHQRGRERRDPRQ